MTTNEILDAINSLDHQLYFKLRSTPRLSELFTKLIAKARAYDLLNSQEE